MEVTIDGVRYVPVNNDEVALSVLVPSVSTRRATFAPKIAEALFGQHEGLAQDDRKRVEILMLTDAKGMLVGDKRNAMVRMARGKFIVFVDDDDRVVDNYLSTLLTEIDQQGEQVDCITFDALVSLNGAPAKTCHYSIKYERDANTPNEYHRLPNHITAVKRVLALACPFPSKQCGEDAEYAIRLKPSIRREFHIDKVLYHYDYSDSTTETQRQQPEPAQKATVDVVMLSKASTADLQRMTQQAIDTCIAGAGHRKVNVIVIEQDMKFGQYNNAQVIYDASDFHYNKFANNGAARGNAPWIMVANNDLVFEDGWLEGLLNTGRDCVSPMDPTHKTQRNVTHDEAGWKNGHHFSGWCFMIRRQLWERIGKFDECVSYWCSDDVVIEQCRSVGVMPLVAHAARVRHLGSQTLKTPGDDLAWGQVKIYNDKFHKSLFSTDQRYIAYLKRQGVAA